MKKKNAGLQIHKEDLDCILDVFMKNFEILPTLVSQNSKIKCLSNLHWMVKLQIPITFLGHYNENLQNYVYKKVLIKIGKIQTYINTNFYIPKVKIPNDPGFEFNSNLLRLSGNLVHVNIEAQNLIFDEGLLPILVGFTRIDMMNPLSKECTIVFIKYMTESNEPVREFLRGLKVCEMETDTKDLLSKLTNYS